MFEQLALITSCSTPCGRLFASNIRWLAAVFILCLPAHAQDYDTASEIKQDYQSNIQPLIKRYCYQCHGTDQVEAEIDLTVFRSIADAAKKPKIWLKIREMLDSGQMPPTEADQPTDAERFRLRSWVRSFLANEARATAGDPGPVLLRRLSNAEYTYSISDLTGLDSLEPALEFPVDGAAGEGFTNTGSGQGMSPALVQKYLDAAKRVAEHAVLLPDKIHFSTGASRRDQTDEMLARIQAFYRQFTVDGGGSAIDLQGIKFNTNQGGLLPLKKYMAATIEEREAIIGGLTTIADVARQRSLNARYLSTLWKTLSQDSNNPSSILINQVREKWRAINCDPAALTTQIEQAQRALWKFNPVGHIGREDGPKSWMQAVSTITTRQELRLKLPDAPTGSEIVIYMIASDLGDGNQDDFVVWQRPRFEFKTGESDSVRPPMLLRDIQKSQTDPDYGLDPARFGIHPNGPPLDAEDLCLQAPQVLQIRLPASLLAGAELVTTGVLHAESGREGSVQIQVATAQPEPPGVSLAAPILVSEDRQVLRRMETAMNEFRMLFPPALCYARLVPVDEVVTLTLFYREDEHLKRLMLDDQQIVELDGLWNQLHYVSQEPLQMVVAFEQISEFATQDRPDLVKALAPMRAAIIERADAFGRRLLETEPVHVNAVLELADRAWRRPLTAAEQKDLRELYGRLRDSEITHEDSTRLLIARVLTSPAFLYKLEQPTAGTGEAPVTDLELATRLSYFLWSSIPDDELRRVAQDGRLNDDLELIAQTRRMLGHRHARRLAIQFACQWLHLRDFDQNDNKNETLFPEFTKLRGPMYEETVRFFEDMFRNDGSILEVLNANHTFLNEPLAKHYGIDGITGNHWRRVDGVRDKGRGGVLGMASFLTSQSGASRTSPILRGNWIYETLLGEQLPRPPADVPQIPDEVPAGLTARQVFEHHSSAAACAKCHVKIDPYGIALEQYDAIGRIRPAAVNTTTKLMDGKEIHGINGLRDYLATDRQKDIVRQFCRKLLGYALGRELQLSDDPLLDRILDELADNDYRFSIAVQMIVTSRQFRDIRSRQQSGD